MRIVLHPDAQRDVSDAVGWYEDREPGLGIAFVRAIGSAMTRLRSQANRYPKWPGVPVTDPPVQRYQLTAFPAYAIAFRCFDDRVEVLAIVHASRRPLFWSRRTSK